MEKNSVGTTALHKPAALLESKRDFSTPLAGAQTPHARKSRPTPVEMTRESKLDDCSPRGSVVGFVGGELLFPGEAGGLQEANAAVPTEDGVIVAGGTNFFGFAKILQGTFE